MANNGGQKTPAEYEQLKGRIKELETELRAKELIVQEKKLLEDAQEKIVKWAQNRFWWVVVLGGLIVGSSGYGLLQGALSLASRATIEAEIATKNAKEETARGRVGLSELEKLSTELDERLKSFNDKKMVPTQSQLGVLEAKLAEAAPQIAQLAKAVEALEKSDEKIAANSRRIGELQASIDERDLILRYFFVRATDKSITSAERTAAAVAVALWPARTGQYFNDVQRLYIQTRDYGSDVAFAVDERGVIQTAMAVALLRSDQAKAFSFLEERLKVESESKNSPEHDHVATALQQVTQNSWDTQQLEWAIKVFEGKTFIFSDRIGNPLSLKSNESRKLALAYIARMLRQEQFRYIAISNVRWNFSDDLKVELLPELKKIAAEVQLKDFEANNLKEIIATAESKITKPSPPTTNLNQGKPMVPSPAQTPRR